MARFGDDPGTFFGSVYEGEAPWDIGRPQPALVQLISEHPLREPVLDVGSGTGDLSIWIATHGLEVLGLDFVPAAVACARERAASLSPEIARKLEFRMGNALEPAALGRRFGSVVDSGFYHLFEPGECADFARELAAALVPGGRYHVLAFAVDLPADHLPRGITETELVHNFRPEDGWKTLALRSAEFVSRVVPCRLYAHASNACDDCHHCGRGQTDAVSRPGAGRMIELPQQDPCEFCEGMAGREELWTVVTESEHTLTVVNPYQFEVGQCCVVTRRHAGTLLDLNSAESAAVLEAARDIALAMLAAYEPLGILTYQNNGVYSGQEVPHYHFHVVPRQPGSDWGIGPPQLKKFPTAGRAFGTAGETPADVERIRRVRVDGAALLRTAQLLRKHLPA